MPSTLSLTERSLPMWLWGAIFITFSIVGLIGLHWRTTPLLQIGHFAIGGTYVVFTLGASVEYWQGATDGNYRTGTEFLMVAAINLLYARKSEQAFRRARLR